VKVTNLVGDGFLYKKQKKSSFLEMEDSSLPSVIQLCVVPGQSI